MRMGHSLAYLAVGTIVLTFCYAWDPMRGKAEGLLLFKPSSVLVNILSMKINSIVFLLPIYFPLF